MPASVPEEILSFSKFVGKTPCWSTFIVELQPANSFKKNQSKDYSVNLIKKETPTQLHRDSYTSTFCTFFKKRMNTTVNTSPRLPLK